MAENVMEQIVAELRTSANKFYPPPSNQNGRSRIQISSLLSDDMDDNIDYTYPPPDVSSDMAILPLSNDDMYYTYPSPDVSSSLWF